MVPIIQDFIPVGRQNRPGLAMVPLYITIHDTDNDDYGADAKRHAQYIKTTSNTDSWHYTVDDTSIYQHLPLDENGWHAGDGYYGQGNRKSIGIEICMNPECDRAKAEANAAWLVAKLLKEVPTLYDYPEAVKQHYNWSWKDCPSVIRARPDGWTGFLARVETEMAEGGRTKVKINIHKDGGEVLALDGYTENGITYAPVRQVVEAMGGMVVPNSDYTVIGIMADPWVVEMDGRKVPGLAVLNRGYVALRELAVLLGYKTGLDAARKTITLDR